MKSAYAGEQIVFSTMHGKEALAQDAFRDILGATVFAPPDLDTDQFGTFAGEVPRTLSPLAAARVKAHLGAQIAGRRFSIASEGSFAGTLGGGVQHHEIVLFVDQERGLEVVEQSTTASSLPSARHILDVESARAYAHAIGFPNQRMVMRVGVDGQHIDKSIDTLDQLLETVRRLTRSNEHVTLEPDFRAHRCPPRAEVIRALTTALALRLATACPACATPGFGRIDVERGVACADCGEATQAVAADILGCGHCSHRDRVPRSIRTIDPQWCDWCNP